MFSFAKHIGTAILACGLLSGSLSGCTDDKARQIPLSGEICYDVTYSDDLRKNNSFGAFLPYNVHGIYNTDNVKLTVKAPLGFGSLSVVIGREDDFVLAEIDKAKLKLDIDGMFSAKEAKDIAGTMSAKWFDETADIAGYESHHVRFFPNSADSTYAYVDAFYVDFPGIEPINRATFMTDKIDRKAHAPGLITALNIKIDESNIMLVISGVKQTDGIDKNAFVCPDGFIETNKEDLFTMYELMQNKY